MRATSQSRRRRSLGLAALGVVVVTPLVATTAADASGSATAVAPAGATAAAAASERQAQFAAAAAEFGVPESVLLGVSYLESRWDSNAGTPSTSGGFGPMHLTDAVYVSSLPGGHHHDGTTEDPRGDESRPSSPAVEPTPASPPAALQTLDHAAALTGSSEAELRSDPAANVRAGAALLADYQRALDAPVGTDSDPGAWYAAVARYSGADVADAARWFADEVYATMRQGASRVTDDGHQVTLDADPDLRPDTTRLEDLGLRQAERSPRVECPRSLSCEWIPAAYALRGDGTDPADYGHYDLADRPGQQKIEYIIVHDTEGYFDPTVGLVQDVTWPASWQYTLRSVDGHIAQHIRSDDVAWQAGNWFVNAKSIGLEHEGFAAQGTWYTEAMYRTSAKLVRYLAEKFDIPLDRQHILGHDNVPGTIPSTVAGMHWDPGPYWDWAHYFDLLDATPRSAGSPRAGLVTIYPDFASNRPAFTGCEAAGVPCPSRASSSVILHSAPSFEAPLVVDVGLHPDGSPSTMHISDHGARAATGQQFAIAGREGDWTAIWYLGQKAWFHNPADEPTALWSAGLVVTPKRGLETIPVFGRAYPEPEAYPPGVPVQSIVPLQYTLSAGQRYAAGPVLRGEYYRAVTIDGSSPGDWTVIRGKTRYVQIQFGHRVGFVKLDDVRLLPSVQ